MHRKRHTQHKGDCQCRRTSQQAKDQRQATEELDQASQQGKQYTRLHAQGFTEKLAGALQTITTKPAKQLLRTVGHQHQTRSNANQRVAQGR